ncbi:hypothetical protein V6R21_09940 [Limibacter armeniacum]|uniref:hypothetical protein n=1 Tax=Limibacter armeniacum TaxID=466084 RepID=UPI002FE51E1D
MQKTTTAYTTYEFYAENTLFITRSISIPPNQKVLLEEEQISQQYLFRFQPYLWLIDLSKVLIDTSPVNVIADSHRWLEPLKLTNLKKVAYLVGCTPSDSHTYAKLLIEEFELSHGSILYKSFIQEAEAMEWLLK